MLTSIQSHNDVYTTCINVMCSITYTHDVHEPSVGKSVMPCVDDVKSNMPVHIHK